MVQELAPPSLLISPEDKHQTKVMRKKERKEKNASSRGKYAQMHAPLALDRNVRLEGCLPLAEGACSNPRPGGNAASPKITTPSQQAGISNLDRYMEQICIQRGLGYANAIESARTVIGIAYTWNKKRTWTTCC